MSGAPAARSSSQPGNSALQPLRDRLEPLLRQAWLNYRVWIPGLANPDFRSRAVVYWARESRVGLEWRIPLPRRCWACEVRQDLEQRPVWRSVRAFEFPLGIQIGTALLALPWAIWLWFAPGRWPLGLLATTLGGGAALLVLKSWQERALVIPWSCQEHMSRVPEMELAVDEDHLHLLLPDGQLAEEARAELEAQRRARKAYSSSAEPSNLADTLPYSPTGGTAPNTPVARREVDLSPIDLAEDEPPTNPDTDGDR